jgi:isoquinoline 1-oxidoreductase beta subunit
MNGPLEQKTTGTSTRSTAEPLGVGRRRFLTWMIAAPTLTMGAKFGLDLLAPSPTR